MLQRRIWWVFLLILGVGIAVSVRIVFLGDAVQAANRLFIAEKFPLSQRIGELRGVVADEERLLYEYYSYIATREDFQKQRVMNSRRLDNIVEELEKDMGSRVQAIELRSRLAGLDQLSDELSTTLGSKTVNWDFARAILAQVKPKVRQIEETLATMSSANRQAVDRLGMDSQSSVSNMVGWVFGFSVLIIVVALFVAYYVVAIIRAEGKLKYQAFFDPETGLPNQYRLREELNAEFKQQRAGTVMMIVADREQEIFESLGAVETERWLIKVALRLRDGIYPKEETLYRFGGNAFVLVSWPGDLAGARRRAAQLLSTAQQPLHVERRELFSTLSIGTAMMESGTGSIAVNIAEVHVQQAASACNRVRRAGGNDFAIYDEDMGHAAAKTLKWITDLQHAVENGELRLYYQPQLDTASGRLLGMEALVRWMHPLRVGVNLSARQFGSGSLLADIDAALSDSSLPASSLELEITESMVMENPERVIDLLDKIRSRDIHLSLDDFGTGHSSLAYLKRFPIDTLKIDRAFIKDIPANSDDVAIARTIVAMAKSLELFTVAEGIETAEQYELLKTMGCDQVQGYYFSLPLPANEFKTYYSAHI